MRFLLDTNILIPLEDSKLPIKPSLANFVRIANEHEHRLVYHPASKDDIQRDKNANRRKETLERLTQYTELKRIECPWNQEVSNPNDIADNEILYALFINSAHVLITEDRKIHDNAKKRNLVNKVYTIQTAEDLLRRLHEKQPIRLPNIENVNLYELTSLLDSKFFDSLREGYPEFDDWFRKKAQDGRKAWVNWETKNKTLGGICVYTEQENESITNAEILPGKALKLSTFKVAEISRGKKIGELFLKAAFRYATENKLEHIFIHGDLDQHHFLFEMLENFGFKNKGTHIGSNNNDVVYVKSHPVQAPDCDQITENFEYLRKYFPHFCNNESVKKFVVPIKPQYHKTLFPDYFSSPGQQMELFQNPNQAGNAIKMAYLCHAPTKTINPGSIVFFYRSQDDQSITSIGIVESYEEMSDTENIISKVKRRTVYSMQQIKQMAKKTTRVMLFRLVRHLNKPLTRNKLKELEVFSHPPQSITEISHEKYERIQPYIA